MSPDLQHSVRQIEAVELADDRQRQFRDQILDFCRTHPDALHRTCLEGHLTGSAAVVDPGRRAAVILHHVKLDRWLQPGGHADGDSDLAAVALREATEETGIDGLRVVEPAIDLDVHLIPARPGEPEHLHLDVRFVAIAPPNCEVDGNHESHDLAWWNPDGIGPEPDESTRRLLRAALATL
ncbi:MAG: NUDIX hydrolase [Acidimicrobiia bacterium]|nr:NUDIX hydrolase [Acidimicrobiia bacterium]